MKTLTIDEACERLREIYRRDGTRGVITIGYDAHGKYSVSGAFKIERALSTCHDVCHDDDKWRCYAGEDVPCPLTPATATDPESTPSGPPSVDHG